MPGIGFRKYQRFGKSAGGRFGYLYRISHDLSVG
jgi:hypothetical protein